MSKKKPTARAKLHALLADEIEAKVLRFFELQDQVKPAVKELDELKDWFKVQAGDNESADFLAEGMVVSVMLMPGREGWDEARLRETLAPAALQACRKVGEPFKQVVGRKAE